jgi:hypothetical protein
MRYCPPCYALASSRDALCACAKETKCDQTLARLWFLTRLSPTRSDRTQSRGALLQDLRPAILRPSVAGLLSRKMERRRVRSLLDADADWADVELWPIAPYRRFRKAISRLEQSVKLIGPKRLYARRLGAPCAYSNNNAEQSLPQFVSARFVQQVRFIAPPICSTLSKGLVAVFAETLIYR